MRRRELPGALGGCSVQAPGDSSFKLLLQNLAPSPFRVNAHATGRRDLHGPPISRVSQDRSRVEKGGLLRQSQTCPESDEAAGIGEYPAWTQHLKTSPKTHQIPLPASRSDFAGASGGMEHRHHLYPIARWVCIPRGRHRLVQQACVISPSFQQPGSEFLLGRFRRGDRIVWKAKNFQYRPGGAVYLKGVCGGRCWSRYSLQHGRTRTCPGQRVRGTFVEVSEI